MKLIITDLDKTLLRSDTCISDYTLQVLERCRQKGNIIAFSSARAESAMARFVEAVKPDIIVSNGGATVNVGGSIIYRNLISERDVGTIVSMCREKTENKGLITVECDNGYFCNFVPTDPDRRAAFSYSDFESFNTPAYKITAELEYDEWAKEIQQACPGCTLITYTGERWHRFAAQGSDKENALKVLEEHLGIDLSDVIAFGDDINDLGMLKLSGIAVAVSNAIDEIKAAADYITYSNDCDGVAKFLEKMLLD